MKYREIMEAIPHRPRNIEVYLKLRIKELRQMVADLATAKQLIDAGHHHGEANGEPLLRYAFRYAAQDMPEPIEDSTYLLLDFSFDRDFQLERLLQSLESYQQYRGNFLKYVMSALEDAQRNQRDDYMAQVKSAFTLLPYAEHGFEKYGYAPGDPTNDDDPEYVAAQQLLQGYRIKQKVFDRIVPLEADLMVKLGVIQRMTNHDASMRGSEKYRPEHGEVETLYHATAYVHEILRDGFLAERPADRKGVGSFGQQQLISFSHDLEISRNIMRSFKEIWMIAHGQLTGQQIMGWARAEGIEAELRKTWNNIEGSRKNPYANPDEVVKLYRLWLALSKLRDNPALVSPWEIVAIMKSRSLNDIGVLACQVRLEQTDKYEWAEAEFRLPADRVLAVKQVL